MTTTPPSAQRPAAAPARRGAHRRGWRLSWSRGGHHHPAPIPFPRRLVPFLVAALVLSLGVVAGTAYAYVSASGSGTGSATVSIQAVGFLTPTTPSSLLYPGGTADMTVKVHNPNPYQVTVTTVVGSGMITPTSEHSSCTPTGVTFTTQTGLTGYTIAATGTLSLDFTGAAYMNTSSSTGCQNATFTIPVTVTVKA